VPVDPPLGVYETVLYAEDLDVVTAFYRDALGLRLVDRVDGLLSSFRLAEGSMFLIFDPRSSSVPDRPAPSHGVAGPGHVAFRVNGADLKSWRTRLLDHGVAIEQDSTEAGQLYFRDPAGNSVELVGRELWPV
jgi:catechol 2,3-dioxygenase-like lactoylglutathione lyase family enzyme